MGQLFGPFCPITCPETPFPSNLTKICPTVVKEVQAVVRHVRQWPGLAGCLCTSRETIALGCLLLGRKWLKLAECGREMRVCENLILFSLSAISLELVGRFG